MIEWICTPMCDCPSNVALTVARKVNSSAGIRLLRAIVMLDVEQRRLGCASSWAVGQRWEMGTGGV